MDSKGVVDVKSRKLYQSLDDAVLNGAEAGNTMEVTIVTISSGPFKGRVYARNPKGSLVRVFPQFVASIKDV